MNTLAVYPCSGLNLTARTAAELMTTNPVSLRDDISLKEAIAFLVDRGISGAAVIDEAGRPVGVLSQSDIMTRDREAVEHLDLEPHEVECGYPLPRGLWDQFQVERVDATPVRDLMTPAVFCVPGESPAWSVIQQMRDRNVHRLFVVDDDGVLVGIITAMDILRHLDLTE